MNAEVREVARRYCLRCRWGHVPLRLETAAGVEWEHGTDLIPDDPFAEPQVEVYAHPEPCTAASLWEFVHQQGGDACPLLPAREAPVAAQETREEVAA
jgi:hypothetical protein